MRAQPLSCMCPSVMCNPIRGFVELLHRFVAPCACTPTARVSLAMSHSRRACVVLLGLLLGVIVAPEVALAGRAGVRARD